MELAVKHGTFGRMAVLPARALERGRIVGGNGKADAEMADEGPCRGTSRMAATRAGSRIDTHPRPIPSARAASQSVWMALTTE